MRSTPAIACWHFSMKMSISLSYHFWNSGDHSYNEEYEKIEGCDDGVIMHLKSGKKLKADCLLYANGGTGNTDWLALQTLGWKLTVADS